MMCERATGKSKQKLIQITHAGFTSTNPNDFPNVTGMVVDPSCSGSGIFGRAIQDSNSGEQEEEAAEQEVDTERLNKLAGFQFKIVKHALMFPLVRKLVYLTCSIHPHENERVVVDLLNDPELKQAGWVLAERDIVIPSWPKRGWKEEFTSLAENEEEAIKLAGGCVRAEPKVDGGIGFFAACFIKSGEYENSIKNIRKVDEDEDEENEVEDVVVEQVIVKENENEENDEWNGFE